MQVVLWDTRNLGGAKDSAGGFGVGPWVGTGGLGDRLLARLLSERRRPPPLLLAHLAAVFRLLGHRVRYVVDRVPPRADLYVFCPSLVSLPRDRAAAAAVLARQPSAAVLVAGRVATALPQVFAGLKATIVKGDAEQLLWRLDDVLARPAATVQLGSLEDLDKLPPPDWAPLRPGGFRLNRGFRQFPTAWVETARGCAMGCGWCPHAVHDPPVRLRQPEAVLEEIRQGARDWGFRSFVFRDPLFGWDPARVFQLVRLLGRLPAPIQFSVRTRPELLRPEMLRVLKRVGLAGVTVDVPPLASESVLGAEERSDGEARLTDFFALCRTLGLCTGAQCVVGFPDDKETSFRATLALVERWNPHWAEFRLLTPYPGTPLAERLGDRIDDCTYCRYSGHAPLWRYAHLDGRRVRRLEAECWRGFYWRWQRLRRHVGDWLPRLGRFVAGVEGSIPSEGAAGAHDGPPRPASGAELFRRRKGLRQDGPHPRPGMSSGGRDDRDDED